MNRRRASGTRILLCPPFRLCDTYYLKDMKKSCEAFPVLENVPLAPYTTLGVGGPARFLIKAKTGDHISGAMEFARARRCEVFILGGGSNLVVSDSGFPGVVIKIEIAGIEPLDGKGSGKFSVGAGVEWDIFVQHCVQEGLAGIECLSGIPGTVGAAPVQNIGAYGEDVSEVISRIVALDRVTNRIIELNAGECQFTYRRSIFNTSHKNRYIILNVIFALRTDGQSRIHYPDIQKRFTGSATPPGIGEVREAVIQTRQAKAMILRDADPDTKSVGSFFKNPVLDLDIIERMETEAHTRGILGSSDTIPRFPAAPGKEKLPAAWLVEHAGFHKGYVHKNAGISSRHALAIINRGGATAQEIVDLMRLVQARVQEVFGVELHPEPVFVGFGVATPKTGSQNSDS